MEKISVIIPVYNVEKYLEECVDSVLRQTYRNFEIILVDDGSTDSSGDICDRYAREDERIRVIHKKNGGASSARNIGLNEAKGEYIYFLDSDDCIVSSAFDKLIEAVDESNADIVFFEADTFSDADGYKDGNYTYKRDYGMDKGKEVLSELMENKEFHVSIPLLLINKEFLNKANVRLMEGIMYEDMIFTFEVFSLADKVFHLQEKLYKRRYRADSVMTNKKSFYNFKSAEKVMDELLKFSDENGILNDSYTKKHLARCCFNYIGIYSKLKKEEKKACRYDFKNNVNLIKINGAFGNRALYARCYGKLPWFIYKCFEKVFG